MTIEDDYGMIDGVINNGRRGEELEKVKEATEKKPSIRERLEDAKREYAERPKSEKAHNGRNAPEHGDLWTGARNGGWNGISFLGIMAGGSITKSASDVFILASKVSGQN